MQDLHAELVATIRWQVAGCRALGATFYAELCEELERDVEADGPTWDLLAPYASASFEAAYVLRLLGGTHRLVLSGQADAIAAHFPNDGGDGDAREAMNALRDVLADPPPEIFDALSRPPQTNEVGRSAALASGLLVIAEETGLPLRLREIGSSGGLNLRLDRYWHEQDGAGWGDPASSVRFVDMWQAGAPPFRSGAVVKDRRGCDRDPIDATTRDGALKLLSYVWPESTERLARLRDAIDIARRFPAPVDQADVVTWLPAQLTSMEPGTTLVVLHSIVWQYLDDETRNIIRAALDQAGANATRDRPLAWLRLEPHPATYAPAELRVTIWNGESSEPADRLLATASFHVGPITWVAQP